MMKAVFLKRYFVSLLMIVFVHQISFAQNIVAPRLTCVVNDFVGSNVNLTWQNNANPCGPFLSYIIYASTSQTGPYNVIGTITTQGQTTFTHLGALGSSPTWFYYMEANFTCPGATILQSDTIQNEFNPRTPVILSTSVNPDNTVSFNWVPSTSSQTKFYIIYAFLPNGSVVPIDTVFGRTQNQYTDLIQDPSIQSVGYTIAAADSCVGNQPSAFNTSPHSTIYLANNVARCNREIRLLWNRYQNFPAGVKEYQIWVNQNLGGFQLVGTTDSATTNFPFTSFNDGDSICIAVAAVSAADTLIKAFSNYNCLRPSIVQPPDFVYIKRLSIGVDDHVDIEWMTDPQAELLTHEVMRTEDCQNFLTILNKRTIPPFVLDYIQRDSSAFTQEIAYCYQIKAVDSCQGERISPIGKTIFLQAELTDYYEIKLDWNEFQLHAATVLRYHIYRNYGTGWQRIQTLPAGSTSYRDSLYQFLSEKGDFCYYIGADYFLNLPDVPFSDTLTTTSNRVCLFHRPIIFIPNAFVPGGVNSIFKPTIFFGDPSGYSLMIFSRYGGKIFESNDPAIGWDGTDRGKLVQQGGYAYLIKFTSADGTQVERKGIVVLLRN
jgi:hypothetical protein